MQRLFLRLYNKLLCFESIPFRLESSGFLLSSHQNAIQPVFCKSSATQMSKVQGGIDKQLLGSNQISYMA